MSEVQKSSCVEVVVDASVPQVWGVIADVTRVGEWSHECYAARWLGQSGSPAVGARFRGRNRAGWVSWSRICEITTVDAPREISWRTVPTLLFPDSTQWRIRLESVPEGHTRISQSFTVLRAPWLLDRLYARLIPAHRDRDQRLAEDLARVGAAASGGAQP